MEAQGERLLQDLVTQEKNLVAKVEDARKQASEIVSDAQEEARRILEEARGKAEALAKQEADRGAKEADAAREDIVHSARETVGRLEAQARAGKEDAVALVMERVLP